MLWSRAAARRTALPVLRFRSLSSSPFEVPPDQLVLGCVASSPDVMAIWEGMKKYLWEAGVPFDFVVFATYERQVRALLEGHIDVAWNGPLAHVLAQEQAAKRGLSIVGLGMRDVDMDVQSVVVARRDAGVTAVEQLEGKVVMTGASDSPQAHLVPLHWLMDMRGIDLRATQVFDEDLGKHGDTALGEVRVMEALLSRFSPPAALLSRLMWDRALQGLVPGVDGGRLARQAVALEGPGDVPPPFDHRQFDALSILPEDRAKAFQSALMGMDWEDPEHQRIMEMEGIQRRWAPPREEGYAIVRNALRSFHPHVVRRAYSTRAGPQKVGIVGCDVGSLPKGRLLRTCGLETVPYNAAPRAGALRQASNPGYSLQVLKQLYQFLGFLWARMPRARRRIWQCTAFGLPEM